MNTVMMVIWTVVAVAAGLSGLTGGGWAMTVLSLAAVLNQWLLILGVVDFADDEEEETETVAAGRRRG